MMQLIESAASLGPAFVGGAGEVSESIGKGLQEHREALGLTLDALIVWAVGKGVWNRTFGRRH